MYDMLYWKPHQCYVNQNNNMKCYLKGILVVMHTQTPYTDKYKPKALSLGNNNVTIQPTFLQRLLHKTNVVLISMQEFPCNIANIDSKD
jgi:hypothetical protein